MIDLSGWVALIDLIVLVAVSFGVFLAFRTSMANAERAIQDRVIIALKDERELLNSKIQNLERDYARQNSVLSTIRYALMQRGLRITIEGEFVTLSEAGGKLSKVTRIQDRSTQLDDDMDAS